MGNYCWTWSKEKNLFLQNISPLCRGLITKQRSTISSEEKSILDYLITCEILHGYLEKMVIDDAQIFSLMKYASVKGKQKKVIIMSCLPLLSFNFNFKKQRRLQSKKQRLSGDFHRSKWK